MIIDVHAHIAFDKIYPPRYLTEMIEVGDSVVDNMQLLSFLKLFLRDNYCDQMVKQMDGAGIQKSVLLIIDGGVGIEEPVLSLESIFDLHHEVLLRHPDRFIVFAGVDPRRGAGGLNLFKRSVTEFGFKGLKLYPPMGYAMDDPRLYDYYDFCGDNNLCVLIHTGPSLSSLHNELADPKWIHKVALDHPNVNFILAHAGYRLRSPSVQQVMDLPNVFFDIAGFQYYNNDANKEAMDNLSLIFQEPFNSKVIFGSDWPLFNLITPISTHIKLLENLFLSLENKVTEGLSNIFFNNARAALRI